MILQQDVFSLNCLEILRAFCKKCNGEATVNLVLRHIAQILETSQAAVVAPPMSKHAFVSIGDYDPFHRMNSCDAVRCFELSLVKDGHEVGILSFIDEKGKCGNIDFLAALEPAREVLVMSLTKWQEEKLQIRSERYQERLESRLKRQNVFLNSLYSISMDMVQHKEYNSLMNNILRHAQNILAANFAAIYILNEARGLLEMKFIGAGVDESLLGLSLQKGQGGAGKAWEKGEFLLINDYPNWGNRVKLSWLDGVGTIAFMPLGSVEKLIGIICLGFAETDRKVAQAEKALLRQFASLAALVTGNLRLFNEVVKRDEEFIQDINLATEVQQAYLPFNYDDPRVRVNTLFQPLLRVSGDLYDYFWSMKGEVLFGYVADVTGHGVTAGLRTVALSVLFREAAVLSLPLIEKMKWVHGRSLGYFSEGAYFAAICFEIDLHLGELRVVCGGLYEFFIKTRYFIGRIEMSGSLMGLKKTPSFEERTYPVSKGDCFYFLTDGLSELIDSNAFPKMDFHESYRYLEKFRNDSTAWDDRAGLCIQIKPDKIPTTNNRPEIQVCFIGFEEFHTARLQITAFIERNYPADADDILLAFHEAAGNALRHGSDTKPVFIRVRDYPGYMSIRIKDSGRGFDSRIFLKSERVRLENPESALLALSGRGIGIMLACVDRVCYSVNGTEVLLLKKLRQQH